MTNHKITNADIKGWAKNYNGPLFDGILCDPPYELGFMGKSWDSSGIAFDTDMWADLFKLVKPGGHLLAFSGSRTYHRMAVAIEDAGFEIRDMIEWVYGSGFPKSLNIGKALDKSLGEQRERIKVPEAARDSVDYGKYSGEIDDNNPITEEAAYWNGYGTALKPAHEPCVLARKPIEGTVANNVLTHGTGGLNIDGTRVAGKWNGSTRVNSPDTKQVYGDYAKIQTEQHPQGRFPANLIHDGSDEVVGLFPETSKSVKRPPTTGEKPGSVYGKYTDSGYERGYTDNGGSAARFFYCAKSSRSERNLGLDGTVSIVVQLEQCENNITKEVKLAQLQVVMDSSHLKATAESGIGTKSGTEWSMSLFGNPYTEKYLTSTKSTTKTETSSITPSIILNYLTGLLTSENTLGANCEMTVGGSPAESVENSNTLTLTINEKTASALGVENAQSPLLLKISVNEGRNFHSTVKPLSLTKYLANLIKPPTGGRLLVPFSGSGSEMIGALQAGWEYVEGVELTEEYIPIAEARIKHWTEQTDKQVKLI